MYRIFYFLIHHIYLLKQRSSGICSFESKVETDLYEFAKKKTQPLNMTLSPRGDVFATMAEDRKIRLFRILTGKLITVIDESLQHYTELQQVNWHGKTLFGLITVRLCSLYQLCGAEIIFFSDSTPAPAPHLSIISAPTPAPAPAPAKFCHLKQY